MNDFRKFLSACLEVEKILFTTPAWSSSCVQLVEVDRMEVIRRINLHGVPYNWRREKDFLIVSGEETVSRKIAALTEESLKRDLLEIMKTVTPAKTTEEMGLSPETIALWEDGLKKPWEPGEIPS